VGYGVGSGKGLERLKNVVGWKLRYRPNFPSFLFSLSPFFKLRTLRPSFFTILSLCFSPVLHLHSYLPYSICITILFIWVYIFSPASIGEAES